MDISIAAPLSIVDLIALLLGSLAAFAGLMISEKRFGITEPKKIFLITMVSFFLIPVASLFAFNFLSAPLAMAYGLLPFLSMFVLNEIFLSSDRMMKLKITIVAYLIYGLIYLFLLPFVFSAIPL